MGDKASMEPARQLTCPAKLRSRFVSLLADANIAMEWDGMARVRRGVSRRHFTLERDGVCDLLWTLEEDPSNQESFRLVYIKQLEDVGRLQDDAVALLSKQGAEDSYKYS